MKKTSKKEKELFNQAWINGYRAGLSTMAEALKSEMQRRLAEEYSGKSKVSKTLLGWYSRKK